MKEEVFHIRACDARVGDILLTSIYLDNRSIFSAGDRLNFSNIGLLEKMTQQIRVIRYMGVQVKAFKDLHEGDVIVSDSDSPSVIRLNKGTIVTSETLDKLKTRGQRLVTVEHKRSHIRDKAKVLVINSEVKTRVLTGVKYIFSDDDPIATLKVANDVSDLLCTSISESDATSLALEDLKVSDEYTFKHSVDVATMAAFLGSMLGMDDNSIHELALAGLLHDIGKTKIPNEIINKPSKLTDEEFAIIQTHPKLGYDICKQMGDVSQEVMDGVLQHQEKYNGRGYPDHMIGCDISLFGRILCVCDVYDALVTPRSYKSGMHPLKAMHIMMEDIDHFDDYYLAVLRSSIQFFNSGEQVTLTDGRTAYIVYNNVAMPFRPVVRIGNMMIDLHDKEFSHLNIVGVPKYDGGVYEVQTVS